MNLKEYASYDALGLAELVKSKKVTPEELVDLALQGIEDVNPKLNAVIATYREKALDAIKAGLPKGPFEGVPLLLKEIILHEAGMPQSMGSRFAKDFAFPVDSYLMERYRAAGFVVIGQTPSPEFAFSATTESVLHGATHNPWGLGHSPGGSSGGAGAVVAAGIVPIAHANDGGGSIRIPASNNGVIGLKPTRGRVTCGPFNSEPIGGNGIEFGMTKTIRDTAALLDAVSEEQPGEYCYAPKVETSYIEAIKQPVRKLRIAYSGQTATGSPVSDDVLKALANTVESLRALGHDVVEATPVYDATAFLQATGDIWSASLYAMIKAVSDATGVEPSDENLEAVNWQCYLKGRDMSSAQYLGAVEISAMITRQVGAFMVDYDVFLSPVMAAEPIKHGVLDSNKADLSVEDFVSNMLGEIAPFTAIFNTTGQPAISLPLCMSENGLPIGMQFAGQYGDEATLLQLGAQLEEATPWSERVPTVHVGNN